MGTTEDYHPCEGQEFKDVMRNLADCDLFANLSSKIFPELTLEEAKEKILSFDNIRQFQSTAMFRGCEYIIAHSMSQFTYSGEEHLDGKPCLFISNHRDIVLDAMMLQYILIQQGHDTSHVVVGSNLWEMPLLASLARVNKMYGIDRGGTHREYYDALMKMSHHLRHLVAERGESVWIAQRNGRTKDGLDHTDPALIKMIAASGDRSNPVSALDTMHIVPVSVSYEWEPCGLLKARELCLRQQGPYTKRPGEDTQSIISGITDFKGHVHFSICKPIELSELEATNGNFDLIAALIDHRISQGYHIWPNNMIAQQMLHHSPAVASSDEYLRLTRYLNQACTQVPLGDNFRNTLLGIYANSCPEETETTLKDN